MAWITKESFLESFRDIANHKVRNIITLLGIVLGTMSIVVVISLANGIKAKSLEFLEKTGNLTKIEVDRNWQYREKDVKKYITFSEFNELRSILPEVKYFNPEIREWDRYQYENKEYRSPVYGVLSGYQYIENWSVEKGRFISEVDDTNRSNVIVIGTEIKKQLFGKKRAIGEVLTFADKRFTVIGIMEHKFFKSPGNIGRENQLAWMNRRAFIPFSTMYNKIDKDNYLYSFNMQARRVEDIPAIKEKTEDFLLNIRKRKPVFEIETAKDEIEEMKKNNKIFSVIFVLISAISLLVGGIVIMNIMLATIKERTREIGVRMAVGAKGSDIFFQFLIQTFITTLLGGFGGIILGISILGFVENFLGFELVASFNMVLTSVIITGGVGLFFGIFPAVRASKLDPIKALRYE